MAGVLGVVRETKVLPALSFDQSSPRVPFCNAVLWSEVSVPKNALKDALPGTTVTYGTLKYWICSMQALALYDPYIVHKRPGP